MINDGENRLNSCWGMRHLCYIGTNRNRSTCYESSISLSNKTSAPQKRATHITIYIGVVSQVFSEIYRIKIVGIKLIKVCVIVGAIILSSRV